MVEWKESNPRNIPELATEWKTGQDAKTKVAYLTNTLKP